MARDGRQFIIYITDNITKIGSGIDGAPAGIFEADQIGEVVIPEEYRDRTRGRGSDVRVIQPGRLEGNAVGVPMDRFSQRLRQKNLVRGGPTESGTGGDFEGGRADGAFRRPQTVRERTEKEMERLSS